MKHVIDANGYAVDPQDGDVCPALNYNKTAVGGASTDIIPAPSDTTKMIQILTMNVSAASADNDYNLSSDGTVIWQDWAKYKEGYYRSEPEIGVIEGKVGKKITATLTAGSNINFSGRYREYTPRS